MKSKAQLVLAFLLALVAGIGIAYLFRSPEEAPETTVQEPPAPHSNAKTTTPVQPASYTNLRLDN